MVDPASSEIQPDLDLDSIDVEAVPGFDLRAFVALEIGILEPGNERRIGCQISRLVARQVRVHDQLELAGERVLFFDYRRRKIGEKLFGNRFELSRHEQEPGRNRDAFPASPVCLRIPNRAELTLATPSPFAASPDARLASLACVHKVDSDGCLRSQL
jgi:hypothetical protein